MRMKTVRAIPLWCLLWVATACLLGATDGTQSAGRKAATLADKSTSLATPVDAETPAATAPNDEDEATQRRITRIFAGKETPKADDLSAMQKRIQKVSSRVVAATVGVRVDNAHGSGVIVSPDGYVLTAAHVAMEANRTATVILADGSEYEAQTLGMELGLDAGMVKLKAAGPAGKSSWPALKMDDSRRIGRGQWCLATGHPGGFRPGRQPVLRIGRILNSSDSEVLTDCTLVGGDSGGPLLDLQGRVIGIHSRIGAPLTANLHVPVSVFRNTWDALVNSEMHGPYLGVRHDQNAELARVEFVPEGSPAAKGGLKSGDIVVSFDDNQVKDFHQLREYVLIKRPGDKVTLGVIRDGENLQLQIALGDWSESPNVQR